MGMTQPSIVTLKRKLKQKTDEVKLLQQITNTISYNLNIAEVLHDIVTLISKTMNADACLVYLADNRTLVLKASKVPHSKMINKVAMKFGEGITGWVADHKKRVVIDQEAYLDKRFKVIPHLDEDNWESFLSVPISYQDDVIAVINVQNIKKKHYTKDQVQLLETIGSQIGGALFNAKLISETRALKQALDTRKVVEKAKGLLMKKNALTEDQAYKLIQKKSMDSKKSMKEVAEAIMLAFNL